MPNFVSQRRKIDERVAVLEPPLGLDIVEDLLSLPREKAIEWIKKHGDPTEMPAAVVLLAHESKVNADVIMATCFDMQRERPTFSIALLAHQMMGLLLSAVLMLRPNGGTALTREGA